MCNDATCSIPSTEEWHKVKEDTLEIDINDGIPLANKFLVAITTGNAMGAQPFKVLVCGKEKVSVKTTVTQKYQEIVGSKEISLDIKDQFMNTDDTNCPVVSYKIVSSSNAPLSGEEATLVSLAGTKLTIKYTKPKVIAF